jgi:hypothetical protein
MEIWHISSNNYLQAFFFSEFEENLVGIVIGTRMVPILNVADRSEFHPRCGRHN